MTESLETRLRGRLAALDAQSLTRTLRPPSGIDLSSNDYLGLSRHPDIIGRFADAIADLGCGSTGSRLLRGERDAFAQIERRFAAFKATERALYFSSGYLANLAVLTTFAETGDLILSDERNHASLIDGIRLSAARRIVCPHNDADALRRLAIEHRGRGHTFIVVESLFSMDGDVAPLREYADVCREIGAALIVDEAHAVGIYGARGTGLVEELGVAPDVFVSINTAGKALGAAGAFVAGPAWAIDYLVQRARPFIFSTAPPPAIAAAIDASLDLIAREPDRRARLRALAAFLRSRLAEAGVDAIPHDETLATQIVPIVLGDNDRALAIAAELQAQGFDVRAIRPPSVPAGSARLRVSVNVDLSEPTLDRFVSALALATGLAAPCSAASS